ncbi:hypothetical protein QYF50_07290 [Paenibacillus vini]|uniref:hypothetical protein n=1 Tax=Paenibacillus vini TaxID=1476024 RepID=UPI0025B700FA|nr:hypothetical protein [Paenibacillus vini]MDN4067696.1 hypothetical protein [Paenibacillus vini]
MKLRRIKNQPGWYEIMSQCPICGSKGWCAINEEQSIVHCMRVPTDTFFDSVVGRQFKHYLDPNQIPNKSEIEIIQADSVDKKPNYHLNRVYRALAQELNLSNYHLEHLRNKRHFDDETIRFRQYRTMPDQDRYKVSKNVIKRLNDQSDLLGVPGFFVQEGKYGPYWTMAGQSGLMIPFRSILNEITGWQIRVDIPPLELHMKGAIKGKILKELDPRNGKRCALCEVITSGKTMEVILTEKDKKVCRSKSDQFVFSIELKQGLKYWWWSSGSKDNGSSIGGPIPYHFSLPSPCMPFWQVGEEPDSLIDCSEVWVTEGGIKADKASDAILKPFFGLPGVGAYPLILEPLKKIGCKHVVLAFDADVVTTPEVQLALELCAQFFAERTDMSLSLAMWDLSLGKGIDDLVDNGYLPQVTKLLD